MKNKKLQNISSVVKAAIFTIALLVQISFGINISEAQIVINESFKFREGDRYTSVSVDTNNVNPGSAGANTVWNFSGVTFLNDPFENIFISPGQAQGSEYFPGATLVQKIDSTYIYSKEEGNAFYSMGMYSVKDGVRIFSDMQKIFQYPFAFNNSFTDSYSALMEGKGYTVASHGQYTLTADAWGTLILPAATYSNSLRVKSVTSNTDTINYEGSVLVSTSLSTNYSWYVIGSKAPVFSISYVQTPFGSYKYVSYSYPVVSGISSNINASADKFTLEQNYPNPFNPSTKISFSIPKAGVVSLKIYDIAGKEVAVVANEFMNAGKFTAEFNASALTSGTYFYRLETNGLSETRKMILVK